MVVVFFLQLLMAMRRKPAGQSTSSMVLLQPLPGLSLLWSTQCNGCVSVAPGLFLSVFHHAFYMRDTSENFLVACHDWIEMLS